MESTPQTTNATAGTAQLKWLNTRYLKVDPRYQRPPNMRNVNRIVREFDQRLVNPPKVSFRDGQYWVYDGQHTMLALKVVNNGDVDIQCWVRTDLTWEDEARLFIAQNGVQTSVSTTQKMRAGFNISQEDIVDMVNIAARHGYEVDLTQKTVAAKNRFICTVEIKKAYDSLGPERFGDMLAVMRDAWDGSIISMQKNMVKGMTKFFKLYGKEVNLTQFKNRLQAVSVEKILQDSTKYMQRGVPIRMCHAIVDVYNARRPVSTRLSVDKL